MTNTDIENEFNRIYAPIAVFAYNRADKITACLKALASCNSAYKADVIVFSDGAKSAEGAPKVEETRRAIDEFSKIAPFKSMTVIKAEKNKGLATSIIEGVTCIVEEYGRVIVVEDDLIVSDKFLDFMNGALEYYQDNPQIGAISAYTYPIKALKEYQKDVYIMHKGDCWGWATWKDRWDKASWADVNYEEYFRDRNLRKAFENAENGWDMIMLLQSKGKVSSWAIRWVLYLLKHNLWTVYPSKSYVTNNGFDGSGTHSNKSEGSQYFTALSELPEQCTFEMLTPDIELEEEAARFPRKGLMANCKYLIKRLYVRFNDLKSGY